MKNFIFSVIIFVFIAMSGLVSADTASFRVYFQGPDFSIAPGSEVAVSVLIDSKDPINAFDLGITYPADKLKFLNSDNSNSVVDIWQTSPSISNAGRIEFSGGILKPFIGTGGHLIKLSFKVLTIGAPKLAFSKSDLYFADGQGTKITADAPSFSLSINENSKIISSPIIPFKSTPSDILIRQELQTFKSEMLWKKFFTPLLIFFGILFVICVLAVYNKFRRKL